MLHTLQSTNGAAVAALLCPTLPTNGAGEIRFNLNQVIFDDPPEFEDLDRRAKAARRGPAWAARLRQEIDAVLASRAQASE